MEKEKASSLSSDNEGQKRSKLAILSFVLSLVPILLIIFYGVIRSLLISNLLIMIWYGNFVNYIPYFSLIFSIVAIILIKRKKIKGMGFAISGLVISIIEIIIFLVVTSRIA